MGKSTSPCTVDNCEFVLVVGTCITETLIALKVRARPRGHEAHGLVERSYCGSKGPGCGNW